jgi:hypothetical protein
MAWCENRIVDVRKLKQRPTACPILIICLTGPVPELAAGRKAAVYVKIAYCTFWCRDIIRYPDCQLELSSTGKTTMSGVGPRLTGD